MKKYCSIIIVSLLLSACQGDKIQIEDMSFSSVTYVKNTLDYPILVQCYFRPFNDNPLWCENEPIAYSEPVEIQPNESKIVMDYVLPLGIKIFKSSNGSLLFENFELKQWGHKTLPEGILYSSSEEAEKLGTFTAKQVVPKGRALKLLRSEYYIQAERYLYKNVPWSLYPIYFDFRGCYENLLEGDESRKSNYKGSTDGYALVNCITFNKYAACFNP